MSHSCPKASRGAKCCKFCKIYDRCHCPFCPRTDVTLEDERSGTDGTNGLLCSNLGCHIKDRYLEPPTYSEVLPSVMATCRLFKARKDEIQEFCEFALHVAEKLESGTPDYFDFNFTDAETDPVTVIQDLRCASIVLDFIKTVPIPNAPNAPPTRKIMKLRSGKEVEINRSRSRSR